MSPTSAEDDAAPQTLNFAETVAAKRGSNRKHFANDNTPLRTMEQQVTAAAAAAVYDQPSLALPLCCFLVFIAAVQTLFTSTRPIRT